AVIDRAVGHWQADPDLEVTLEANPTSVEARKLEGFRAAGVGRVSLGVQALSDADLAARLFPRWSFDLIYARPGQTVAAWEAELRRALRHAGGHLSAYQ